MPSEVECYSPMMFRSPRLWCFAGILLLSIFFRFFRLESVPAGLYPDEAMNGNNAVEVLETGQAHVFYPENNGREGLYIDALALFLKVYPHYEPWVLRAPAAAAGVLTVVGSYLLAEVIFTTSTALLGAFFLATGLWPVLLSRLGFRANFAVMLLTWAVCLAVVGCQRRGKRGLWISAAAGLVYGLSFYTYIPIRVTPPLLLVIWLLYAKGSLRWQKLGLLFAVAAAVALPLGIYFVQHPSEFLGRASMVGAPRAQHPLRAALRGAVIETGMLNIRGDQNWRHNLPAASQLGPIAGVLFWVGVLTGAGAVRRVWRQHSWPLTRGDTHGNARAALLLGAWFLLGFFPAMLSEPPHALRSILMIPPAFLLAGLGCAQCFTLLRASRKAVVPWCTAVLCIGVTALTYVRYFKVYANDPHVPLYFREGDLRAASAINALPVSLPKYVIVRSPPQDPTVHGFPMAAETTMFLTHSYTEQDRAAAHIHYLFPEEGIMPPPGVLASQVFYVGRTRDAD